MALSLADALLTFASIFAIVNPVGNVPTYVSLTEGMSEDARRHIRRQIVMVGPPILVAFMLVGASIFAAFGITLPAFRIAGGILIFRVAFDMLQAKRGDTRWSKHDEADAAERDSIGITPLGVPLYAGPGAISTVMILGADTDLATRLLVVVSVVVTYAVAYLLLKHADHLFKLLGRSGLLVFSRIIGLLLAAVAVQFVLEGLKAALPGLAETTGLA